MECLPKTLPVELQYSTHSLSVGISDNQPQFSQLGLAVGHQKQLMRSMKTHKIMYRCGLLELTKASKGKNTCEKMLAYVQILESAFVFYGQVAKLFQNSASKKTGRFTDGRTLFGPRIDFHVCEAARWRSVFQNEPINLFQAIEKAAAKFPHFFGNVQTRGRLNKPETIFRRNNAHGRARSP